MKRSQANPMTPRLDFPPELPDPYELDELAAASQATAAGAWWISLQAATHVLHVAAEREPNTGGDTPQSLVEFVSQLHLCLMGARHPWPVDELQRIAEFCREPFAHVLKKYRTRVVRDHVMQPFQAIREMDAKSMAWMARLPGRSIREKLAGRQRALGVVRRFSADTQENRVVRRVMGMLVGYLQSRLDHANLYDEGDPRLDVLETVLRQCTFELRRTELASVPPALQPRANNVLLADRQYMRIWRALQRLKRYEDHLETSWQEVETSCRQALLWLVTSGLRVYGGQLWEGTVLAGADGAPRHLVEGDELEPVWRSAAPVSLWFSAANTGGHVGRVKRIENSDRQFGFIDTDKDGSYYFDPNHMADPRRFGSLKPAQMVSFTPGLPSGRGLPPANQVRPCPDATLVEIELLKDRLRSVRYPIQDRGVHQLSNGTGRNFVMTFDTTRPLLDQAGIPLTVEMKGGYGQQQRWQGHADVEGLVQAALWIVHRIRSDCGHGSIDDDTLWLTGARLAAGVRGVETTRLLRPDIHVGIEIGSIIPQVISAAGRTKVDTREYAVWSRLPDAETGGTWLVGNQRRPLPAVSSFQDLRPTNAATELPPGFEMGYYSLALRRVLEALAAELDLSPGAQVSFTVPDTVDEIEQDTLRGAMNLSFGRALPIWRSVAALLGWPVVGRHFAEADIQAKDAVVLLDAEGPCLATTVLVARHSPELEAARPASRGIYWERRPASLPDDRCRDLGVATLLLHYGEALLSSAFTDAGISIADDERTGIARQLVADGSLLMLVQHDQTIMIRRDRYILRLGHDPEAWNGTLASWMRRFNRTVQGWSKQSPLLDIIGDLPSRKLCHIVSVGHPFGYRVIRDCLHEQMASLLVGMFEHGHFWHVPTMGGTLAKGAHEFLGRQQAGLRSWMDWLPDLYLEVVRNGLFDELKLMEEKRIDAMVGARHEVKVSERLQLAAGKHGYRFPLVSGRRNRRPLAHEVRLESASFPLESDLEIELQLSYRYGLEKGYELSVRPVESDGAPFSRLDAQWERQAEVRGSTDELGSAPVFPQRPLPAREQLHWARETMNAAAWTVESRWMDLFTTTHPDDEGLDRCFEHMKRHRTPMLRLAIGASQDADWEVYLGELLDREFARWLEALVGIGEDAPALFVPPYRDSQTWQCINEALILLSSFGTNTSVPVVDHVLERLERDQQSDYVGARQETMLALSRILRFNRRGDLLDALWGVFDRGLQYHENPPFFNRTLATVAENIWFTEDFLLALVERYPGAETVLLEVIENNLNYWTYRVAAAMETDDFDRRGSWLTWPFKSLCEILLALLRLRTTPYGDVFRAGSPRMILLAKYVRRIDAMLSQKRDRLLDCSEQGQWVVRSMVQFDMDQPDHLSRVTPLVYVLNAFLTGEREMNLIRIVGVDDGET